MNRKILVTLLRKDIQELEMITEGFMEMNEYPKTIINLAQRKINDIQSYIIQLQDLKNEAETGFTLDSKQSQPIITDTITDNIEIKSVIEPSVEPETEPIPEIVTTAETEETNEVSESIEIVEYSVTELEKDQIHIPDSISIPENYEVKEVTEVISSTVTETKTKIEDTKKIILGEKINSHTHSRNDSLLRADNSISSTMANKKVDDIKQAISIGDRFRFQRELFRGNGEEMNKTLTYINQLATFTEVQSFLQSKYGWQTDNETVEDFYQIARRKFL